MKPGKKPLHPLTALRFFAAGSIVVHHAQSVFGSSWFAPGFPLWQGVSFFFVLSGFILAYNYPVLARRRDVLLFFAARMARVWPAHAAVMLLLAGFMYLKGGLTSPGLGWIGPLNALLLQAWLPFKEAYFSFNAVAWTLSVELLFYILFPLIIRNWGKTWHLKLLGALLLVGLSVGAGNHYSLPMQELHPWQLALPWLTAVNPLVRVFEFTLGIAMYSIYLGLEGKCSKWPEQLGTLAELLAMIAAAWAMKLSVSIRETDGINSWIGPAGRYYWAGSGAAFAFGVVILVFAFGRGRFSRILSHPLAVRLGEVSFALYLVHYSVVLPYFKRFDQQIALHPAILYLAYWSACLMAAFALFFAVEQPMRIIVLHLAKRCIYPEIRTATPPWRSIVKPMVLGGGIALSLLLVSLWVRPRNLTAVSGAAALPRANGVRAVFDGKFSIEAIRLCSRDAGTVELGYVLKPIARGKIRETLAVHLLDASNNIVGQADHIIDSSQPELGQDGYWLRRIAIPSSQLQGVSRVGLAMYAREGKLYAVRGGNTDWGDRRLILPLPADWKSVCAPSADAPQGR